MDPTIRPYAPRDRDACRDLWRELTERHREIYDSPTISGDEPERFFDQHLEHQDLAGLWVAEVGGRVAGFVGLLHTGDEAEVEPIVVRVVEQGIRRALLVHAEAEARRLGVKSLNIQPVARNIEAIRLFVDEGFELLGHVQLFKPLAASDTDWRRGLSLHGLELGY